MKTTNETRLTAICPLPGYPVQTTVGELVALARRKLGAAYAGVHVATYGGGTQVEVRNYVHGYHGRRIGRAQTYRIDG